MSSIAKISIFLFLFTISCYQSFGQIINPTHLAYIGGIESGSVRRGFFLAQEGVGAMRKITAEHWEHITVDSFSVIIKRDISVAYQYKNKGNLFEEGLQTIFKDLRVNDIVLIFNINATDLDRKSVYLSPLEYKIE